jgi:hypothetical protein
MLDTERQFYSENLAEWLRQYPGKFALVKDRELIGTFDTAEEALAEGARRFGLEPFLVRRVQERADDVSVPALSLGILRANTTPSV